MTASSIARLGHIAPARNRLASASLRQPALFRRTLHSMFWHREYYPERICYGKRAGASDKTHTYTSQTLPA